ncbi:hypothetical protein [uncultured Chryseobacterium sp.]|uniref:hypothetical protein n=1 Tax=uncultured Chryseobacterium sp. TaxID=259322 RepID=UPI002589FC63|nr:hypothetical protein [uncultured Chryseobacterium sp.]
MEEPKSITWKELKEFVNSIPEEYLDKNASILIGDNMQARVLNEPFFQQEDFYINEDDNEDYGTLGELTEVHNSEEDPFIIADYRLLTAKGTPFLWVD